MSEGLLKGSEQLPFSLREEGFNELETYLKGQEWMRDCFRNSRYADEWNRLLAEIGACLNSPGDFYNACEELRTYLSKLKEDEFRNSCSVGDLEGAIARVEVLLV